MVLPLDSIRSGKEEPGFRFLDEVDRDPLDAFLLFLLDRGPADRPGVEDLAFPLDFCTEVYERELFTEPS